MKKSYLWWALAAIATLAFPLYVHNPSYQTIAVFSLIFTASATSWNMFSGYSGYVNLGAAVFYGTGAYTMMLVTNHLHMAGGAAMFWVVPVGGLVAMIVAVPVGLVALRVRRHTFVVITIAIFFCFQLFTINMGFTGGTAGISLPHFIFWNASYYDIPFYYVMVAILFFAIGLSAYVRRTRFGLQLMAIRDDEDRALGLGVNVSKVKLTGYVMSAFVIGAAGAVLAMFQGQIYPQFVFDPLFDISIALMCFFGGFGTLVGPLIGGLLLESAQQWMTLKYSSGGSWYLIMFGGLFLVVILFMPRGIIVYLRELTQLRAERRSVLAVGGE